MVGPAYRKIEQEVGQPIYWQFCLSAFEHALTEPARANARTLLDMVKHVEDLELHVHPAELQTLQDVAADFVQSTGRQQHVTLVADPAVTRGGCVLRTRAGLIDASVESQLERIAATLCEDPSAAAPTDRVAPEGGQP